MWSDLRWPDDWPEEPARDFTRADLDMDDADEEDDDE